MVRKHLEAHELFNKSMLTCLQCEAAALWDMCGFSLRLRGVTLSILGLYLDSSIGLAGVNVDKLNFVAKLLPLLGGRWIIFADWNVAPETLQEANWPAKLGGLVMRPKDMEITCTSGTGAMLDYLLVSPLAQPMVASFGQLQTAPWRPHAGFHLALHGRPPWIAG